MAFVDLKSNSALKDNKSHNLLKSVFPQIMSNNSLKAYLIVTSLGTQLPESMTLVQSLFQNCQSKNDIPNNNE